MTTISPASTGATTGSGGFGVSLTEEQKSTVQDILSQYDSENLSDDDIASIQEQLEEAGIRPSPELGSVIEEAGFDAEAFKPSGPPPEGPPPGPPPGEESESLVSEEGLQTLADILEEYDVENLSEEDVSAIQEKLAEAGYSGQGSVVNVGA